MTIAEIMKQPTGTPIPVACGMVKGVGPRATGDSPAPWSLQNIFIGDATESIPVKIGNHEEIPQTAVGTILYFCAHKKPTGGLSGLKIDMDRQMDNGKPKEWPVLAVARSAEIMTEEQWQARQKPAPAATPAPATAVSSSPAGPTQQTQPAQKPPFGVEQNDSMGSQGTFPKPSEANPVIHSNAGGLGYPATEVRMERTVNTGNYCSEKLGVTIQVPLNGDVETAFQKADQFLKNHLPPEFVPEKGRKV